MKAPLISARRFSSLSPSIPPSKATASAVCCDGRKGSSCVPSCLRSYVPSCVSSCAARGAASTPLDSSPIPPPPSPPPVSPRSAAPPSSSSLAANCGSSHGGRSGGGKEARDGAAKPSLDLCRDGLRMRGGTADGDGERAVPPPLVPSRAHLSGAHLSSRAEAGRLSIEGMPSSGVEGGSGEGSEAVDAARGCRLIIASGWRAVPSLWRLESG